MQTDDHALFGEGVEISSVVELLCWRTHYQPHQCGYTFLLDGENEERSLTYEALDQQARMIGAKLQELGAVGERVLLLYPPGLDYVSAFLGCLYAGAVAVPTYPPNPARLNRTLPRLLALVTDVQATKVLTTTPLLTLAESLFGSISHLNDLQWIATDDLSPALATAWQKPAVDRNSLALLQYTSGSTAVPKGVMLTHGNLLHNSAMIYQGFGHTAHSQGVIWLPPYHDMGLIGGILQPLYGGFPVTLMSPLDFLARPLRWLQAITRFKATTSGGPNFAYDLCVRKTTPEQREKLDLSSWQVAFNGAEPIRPDTMERFAHTFASCGFQPEAFYPCYGLAEATLIVSGPIERQDPIPKTPSTALTNQSTGSIVGCGQVLADQEAVVVDTTTLRACAPGQVGEIWVRGPSIALGYWQKPDLTARTFAAFLAGGEGPFLRTGDLGFLEAGELFVTGRAKDLIIVRGRNYYPHDIEQTVEKSHPRLRLGCGAAFALDREGDTCVIVVQEVKPGPLADDEKQNIMAAVRAAVAQAHGLLLYDVVLLQARSIPKTSSGKIQRYACRDGYIAGELEVIAQGPLAASPQPETALSLTRDLLLTADTTSQLGLLEAYIKNRASHIMGLSVDLHQPLLDAGFDSLTMVELKNCIEAELALPVELSAFFQGVSGAQLAAMLQEQLTTAVTPTQEPIPVIDRAGLLPLSFAQERFWILGQLQEAGMHNISVSLSLTGQLDKQALEEAINAVVQRHEILRTAFMTVDGYPYQQIMDEVRVPLVVIDLDAVEPDRVPQSLITEHGQTVFDLSQVPLLRTTLISQEPEKHLLLLTMPHIISDGWSMGLLVREMAAYYQAAVQKTAVSLPPLPIQYADYAHFRKQTLSEKRVQQCLAYWQAQLKDSPPRLQLPTDYPRPATPTSAGKVETIQLPPSLVKSLKTRSREQGVTLFMTLLAALKVVLSQWTGQRDITIGTVVAGRDRQDLQDLIGCFINFLPIRSHLSPQTTFAAVLQQLRDHLVEAYAYQDCPFEKVVTALKPERKHHTNPFYNVAFLLQNFPQFEADVWPAPDLLEDGFSLLDMRFIAVETPQGLVFKCEYSTDIFQVETIRQFMDAYAKTLAQLAAQPQMQIAQITIGQTLQAQAKASRRREQGPTIAVAATFTAEPVKDAVAFWMQELNMAAEIVFAPYNQLFQQLLDPGSLLCQNEAGLNIVLVQLTAWQRDQTAVTNQKTTVEKSVNDLITALKSAVTRTAIPHLVFCLKSSDDEVEPTLFNQMEALMMAELEGLNGLYLVTSQELAALYPVARPYDRYTNQLGHIPFTDTFFAGLGTLIARKIYALYQEPYKVIVLDCDQTLWQGVCAEDGVQGIAITPYHAALQKFMVAQQEAGRLLCVCSKNDEADVTAVFQQHPDMILKPDHIVSQRINWRPKSENIRALAQELQLGLDTFIFLDDNPLECAEVKANCPQVLTLQLPAHPEQIPQYLNHMWAFDRPKVTAEDKQRTTYYQQNLKRQQHQAASLSLADFLESLELKIDISDVTPAQLPRVAQLTQRTNQFNFNKKSRTESDIQNLLASEQYHCLTVTVSDRFGHYGLVGAAIFQIDAATLLVDTFLLSCRVLGRGVEHRLLAQLGATATARGIQDIEIHYKQTPRSQPALDFLNKLPILSKKTAAAHTIFKLSAAQIQTLTYQPPQGDDAPVPTPKTTIKQEKRTQAASEQQNKIATTLYDAKQILTHIRLQKRQPTTRAEGIILPRTPTETTLAEIWCELLGLEQVSIHADFFDVGGHSLLATQVLSRVRENFHVEIPFQALFTTTFTIEALAQTIEQYQIEQAATQDVLSLLEELDALSEEEAQLLLQNIHKTL